MNTKT